MKPGISLFLLLLLSLTIVLASSWLPVWGQPLVTRHPIFIDGDSDFLTCACITMGTGVPGDPYIIEGWDIDASSAHGIRIENTRSYFIVRKVWVHDGTETAGIRLENVANGVVQNATITRNLYGIWLASASGSIVRDNRILNNAYGLYLAGGSGNIVDHNQVSDNDLFGIWMSRGRNTSILRNNASNNQFGLVVGGGNDNLFQENLASNNLYGFHVRDSSASSFRSNMISNNQFGIYIYNGSGNTVFNNRLENMQANAYDDRSENAWNVPKTLGTNILGGPFLAGNYYNDYAGVDRDGDGVGDTPYTNIAGGTGLDYLPLVQDQPRVVHDVAAISIQAQPGSGRVGLGFNVTATVFNQGSVSETFSVMVLYKATPLGMREFTDAPAWSPVFFSLTWNTSQVSPGTYMFRAEVSVVEGETDTSDNASPSQAVTISPNHSPIASFTFDLIGPIVGASVFFDASPSTDPDGDALQYMWDFGDATTSNEKSPSHIYSSPATYSVSLTVSDKYNGRATRTISVVVSPALPGSPGKPRVTATSGEVSLTWLPPVSNGGPAITGYRIYRGTSAASLVPLVTVGNVTAYRDTSVADGQTYYYRVSAINEAGEGRASEEADIQVPLPPGSGTARLSDLPFFWMVLGGTGIVMMVTAVIVVSRRGRKGPSEA